MKNLKTILSLSIIALVSACGNDPHEGQYYGMGYVEVQGTVAPVESEQQAQLEIRNVGGEEYYTSMSSGPLKASGKVEGSKELRPTLQNGVQANVFEAGEVPADGKQSSVGSYLDMFGSKILAFVSPLAYAADPMKPTKPAKCAINLTGVINFEDKKGGWAYFEGSNQSCNITVKAHFYNLASEENVKKAK